ncbi:MAG: DNA alkylation repair protein [Candidatus Methanomethylophilaceae archaeon]|jgi:3-methyladenine DNA glycosylase AlkD
MTSLKKELEELADPKYREFSMKLIPGREDILGVRIPKLRKIASRIMKNDWHSFLEEESECFEEDMLRAFVIAGADMSSEERIGLTREFVPSVDNWAVCDSLCGDWKADGGSKDGLWEFCTEMLETGEEFPVRIGAVMMLYNFIDAGHINGVLAHLSSVKHAGYYGSMGTAWALSYCYIDYPEETSKAFLSGNMDPKIQNLAVRKITESRRVSGETKELVKSFRREPQ